MRVVLFGTGKLYRRWKHSFDFHDIVCLLDNDRSKTGCIIDGHPVDTPDNIGRYEYDCVFILAKDHKVMRNQLTEMGVSEEMIFDIEQPGLFKLLSPVVSYYSRKNDQGKRVMMLTNTLDLTGAPLVLFDAAYILLNHGFCVHVFSPSDGNLRDRYLSIGASVSIVEDMTSFGEKIMLFVEWSDVCFVNTLAYYPLPDVIRQKGKNIIWWLHEEENYYLKSKIESSDSETFTNVEIFGVGERVINAFQTHFPQAKIQQLLYGVRERKVAQVKHPRTVYALIGSCDHRKGEDLFRLAIQKMSQCINGDCEFWIIGAIDKGIRQLYESINDVRVFGEIDHDELIQLYSQIDILVCPSRNDPMPVVVTEAMMIRKVCIVSTNVGQASIINDGESGLICEVDNAESLIEKMMWAKDNMDKWERIGSNAHELYESYFSMAVFEHKLIEIINTDGYR